MTLLYVILAQTSVVIVFRPPTAEVAFFYAYLQGIIRAQNVDNLIVVGFLIRRCTWI